MDEDLLQDRARSARSRTRWRGAGRHGLLALLALALVAVVLPFIAPVAPASAAVAMTITQGPPLQTNGGVPGFQLRDIDDNGVVVGRIVSPILAATWDGEEVRTFGSTSDYTLIGLINRPGDTWASGSGELSIWRDGVPHQPPRPIINGNPWNVYPKGATTAGAVVATHGWNSTTRTDSVIYATPTSEPAFVTSLSTVMAVAPNGSLIGQLDTERPAVHAIASGPTSGTTVMTGFPENAFVRQMTDSGYVLATAGGSSFLWRNGGTTALPPEMTASAVNEAGVVAGRCNRATGQAGCLRMPDGQIVYIEQAIPSDSGWSRITTADGINGSCQVVGEGLRLDLDGTTRTYIYRAQLPGCSTDSFEVSVTTDDVRVPIHEPFSVTLRLHNDSDHAITDLAFEAELGIDFDEDLIELAPGQEPPTLPTSLAPDARVEIPILLVAKEGGSIPIRVAATGTRDGSPVSDEGTLVLDVRALTVEITPTYTPPVEGSDDDRILVVIDVKVTNRSDHPVTDVVATTEPPVDFTSRLSTAGVALEPILVEGEPVPTEFGTIESQESSTLTYSYWATDRVSANATTIVQGWQGDVLMRASRQVRIDVAKDPLVEVRLSVEQRPYVAGQTVRLFGSLRNVTRVVDVHGEVLEEGFPVGVVLEPTVAGNAGGGHPFPASYGGRTPTTPWGFLIEPDEELDIRAILATLEQSVASNAVVDYEVYAYAHRPDEPPTPGLPGQVRFIETGGSSRDHSVPLSPVVAPPPDPFLTCPSHLTNGDYWSCRLTQGIISFVSGSWELLKLTGEGVYYLAQLGPAMIGAFIYATHQVFSYLLGDETALAELAQEISIDLQALKEVGVEALQGVSTVAQSIIPALAEAIRGADELLQAGDYRTIIGNLAEFAGDNIDAPIGYLGQVRKAMVNKTFAGVAGAEGAARRALQSSLDEQAGSLARRVSDAQLTGRNVATGGILRAGDDVTNLPAVWRQAYGARAEDVRNLLRVARDEGVMIAFRSRPTRAADLIDANQAWPKPSGVSIKTVNDLDRIYLGYLDDWDAKAVLVQPPIAWHPPGPTRDALVDQYLDRFGQLTSPSDFSRDLRASVRERLETRLDEWPVQLEKFGDYASNGIDVNFYANKQGLAESLMPDGQVRRRAQIIPDELAASGDLPTRRVFHLKMAGPDGSSFRDIVGDIDLLAILNLDGTPIEDIAKRVRIYQKLQGLISMQHGESFTFSGKAGLREKFLRCCTEDGEAMLTAMPDERLRATYFKENLSISAEGANADLAGVVGQDFTMMTGITAEAISANRAPLGLQFPRLSDALIDFTAGKVVPNSPLDIAKAIAGLDKVIKPTETFNRTDGHPITSDGNGGLQSYDPPPGTRAARGWPTSGAGPAGARSVRVVEDIAALIADLVAAGYDSARLHRGALGGSWRPISVDDALAGGAPDVFETLPLTYIGTLAEPGSTSLDVLSPAQMRMSAASAFFRAGDRIVIDPGGPREEMAVVAAASAETLTLAAPIAHVHPIGTMVLLPYQDPPGPPGGPGGPGGPGTPGEPDGPDATDPGSGPGGRGPLARTGADLGSMLSLTALLLAAGTVLLALSRRRRETVPSPGRPSPG